MSAENDPDNPLMDAYSDGKAGTDYATEPANADENPLFTPLEYWLME